MQTLPPPMYETDLGGAYVGDARDLLSRLDDGTVDLAITSPPFALQREKDYGNRTQEAYVGWLLSFCGEVHRVLRDAGSLVLDLGGAYMEGRPVRSLYNYRALISLCDDLGFRLAEEFFWHNPAKLPSPIEWVNKRKIRVKDSVDTIWWLSKNDYPKADVRRILVPYSQRMLKLLKDPDRFYSPRKRPSGHDIGRRFAGQNEGSIPPNVLKIAHDGEDQDDHAPPNFLEISNTDSNSQYLRLCKLANVTPHPARFPERLPAFFIDFLTDPGDVVLDFFAGSNTTGAVAEKAGRRWMAFETRSDYLAASTFRFAGSVAPPEALALCSKLRDMPNGAVKISTLQPSLQLRDRLPQQPLRSPTRPEG